MLGQYVIGMCIEEFRDGELLSTVSRDFQFNVLECRKEITAALRADGTEVGMANGTNVLVDVIKACGDSLVFIENLSIGAQLRDYTWEIRDSIDNEVFSRFDVTRENFTVTLPELGFYNGTLIANLGTECPDTAFFRIDRLPEMRTEFEYDTSFMCYLGPLDFTDMTFTARADVIGWNWDFAGEGTSDLQNPSFEFTGRGSKTVTLISTDTNGCIDTMEQIIEYNPPHDSLLIEVIDLELCFGEQYDWYGDIITENVNMNQIITYVETGCDSVDTSIKTLFSIEPRDVPFDTTLCPGEVLTFLGREYSVAGEFQDLTRSQRFDCDSLFHFITLRYDELPEIEFQDESVFVEAFEDFRIPVSIDGNFAEAIWTPAIGLDCDDCPAPTVNSSIDTTYQLELITEINCSVINELFIDFVPIPDRYYLPTVISSTSGGVNDKFFVQTVAWAEELLYDIDIYDRWGGLVHSKRDINVNDESQAWRAGDFNAGAYAYVITVKEFFEPQQFSGSITVIR